MSELINNREIRQKTLESIIKQLHEGKTVEEVKEQFEKVFKGVAPSEISEVESALIMDGMPIKEIQNLCDVHAAVFKGSIEEIHSSVDLKSIPGHPVNILMLENRKLEEIIVNQIRPQLQVLENPEHYKLLLEGINHLAKIDIHYSKKENLLFPFMEKYGITAPPKVMWGVDDEIQKQIKTIQIILTKSSNEKYEVIKSVQGLLDRVEEMIFKEENIMLPMLIEKLTQEEWGMIASESQEFGYLIGNVLKWEPKSISERDFNAKEDKSKKVQGMICLPTGTLKLEELKCLLNTLPFDITFVDKNDVVKYFDEGKERIFTRAKTVIGRNVSNCHPPASVHIVEGIVEDFKLGKKENEDFWIRMGNQYVLIRYFAVRNEEGEYLGVLEVTQNIAPIQALTGEKRLVTK